MIRSRHWNLFLIKAPQLSFKFLPSPYFYHFSKWAHKPRTTTAGGITSPAAADPSHHHHFGGCFWPPQWDPHPPPWFLGFPPGHLQGLINFWASCSLGPTWNHLQLLSHFLCWTKFQRACLKCLLLILWSHLFILAL